MNPRKPTKEEKEQLAAFHFYDDFTYRTDEEEQEAKNDVENAAIAVFDNFVTGSSEHSQKVMVVVWSKSFYQAYTWNEQGLIHILG